MIEKIRALKRVKKIGLFVASPVVLILILNIYVGTGESSVIVANRLKTSWIVGTFSIAFFYHIIFGHNKD